MTGPDARSPPMHADSARTPMRSATVRLQFNRRARDFAERDFVIREIDRRLQERMDLIRQQPGRILDLGCGAGGSRGALRKRFPNASWIGVDHAVSMLERDARGDGVLSKWLHGARVERIAADAGALPLADRSVDLVYSNLMPHWHPDPPRLFAECRRVLTGGGVLLFSCFGPDTLKEVRSACATALPRAAPMPFIDMHDFGDMLVASGFATPVMDAEFLRLTYPTGEQLLREVIALGGNPRDDRSGALVSGRQARALIEALESLRGDDGLIGLTIEVAYGHAWRAPPRERGVTRIDVESLRQQMRGN
jgi:malonyl-CoA O-methyltransferase